MIRFVDLFCGIGGFRLALERLGWACVFSSDVYHPARETYRAAFGETPAGDVREVPAGEVPDHDVLCAGFPCQPFSVSGLRRGLEDTRGTLFYEIARIAKAKSPEVLFLENVPHLERHDGGKTFATMVGVLERMGYRVDHRVLDASRFGVPQSRRRLFIVATRGGDGFEFPAGGSKLVTVGDVMGDPRGEELSKVVIDRDDIAIRPGAGGHARSRRPIRVGRINKGGQGERIYSPSGTAITLSAHGGGAAAKTGAYLVGGVVRKLTVEEALLAQGFPGDHPLVGSESQKYTLVGNSVPPPVVSAVGEVIAGNVF